MFMIVQNIEIQKLFGLNQNQNKMIQINSFNIFKPKLDSKYEFKFILNFNITSKEFETLPLVELIKKLNSGAEKDQIVIISYNQSIKLFINKIYELENLIYVFCEYEKYKNCYFSVSKENYKKYEDWFTPIGDGNAQVFSLEKFRETKSARKSLIKV